MCLMFPLLDCLFSKEIHTTEMKSVNIILKVQMNFSWQNLRNSARSKWDVYTSVHCILNWCQLHHYHISYIMRKQETIHLTTFSTYNWKNTLQLFRLFDLNFVPVGWDLSAYASLLTTPFLFLTAQNTSQHFILSVTGD